ncbi:8810_t:CDS:2 [Gigaspora margarita]|uniref:8810_t:CDS:1 n=1 Tax=Gigaspora margarita TaxID=4874 RepID=A0ABN7UK40_GIGMA|nr:8810_t:CDS:2 [Gigaspora margarita]
MGISILSRTLNNQLTFANNNLGKKLLYMTNIVKPNGPQIKVATLY